MATLAIELQDGFRDDAVVIRAGGHEERLDGVTTNLTISRAGAVELEVDDGPVDVEVEVPNRGLSVETRVDARDRVYVIVNAAPDRIAVAVTSEAPRYL
jgi:hypothetical protein